MTAIQVLLTALLALAATEPQQHNQRGNETTAACSPIVNTNSGTLNIHCSGLDPSIAKKMSDIVQQLVAIDKHIAGDQKSSASIQQKLDSVLSELQVFESRMEGRHISAISAALKPQLVDIIVEVYFAIGDFEGQRFAEETATSLRASGISAFSTGPGFGQTAWFATSQPIRGGVLISLGSRPQEAADILLKWFSDNGIPSAMCQKCFRNNLDLDRIKIFVLPK
jgi:hypothetical protein